MKDIESLIALTPDFPKPGVLFRDISPLLAQRFPEVINAVDELFTRSEIMAADAFAGVDARGFIFAAALAEKHAKNMVVIRKNGKLPPPSLSESYGLEYGQATLEMKPAAKGGRVILLDDVLATGGTMAAAANLCQKAEYEVTAIAALIDLKFLNDFSWNGIKARSVFQYA